MILITGGIGSGKHSFAVRSLGYSEEDLSSNLLDGKAVFCGLQDLIREKGTMSEELKEALLKKEVVISEEVGCGVVPLDAQERSWRDEVGRTQVDLATEADTVIRMVCGIPQVIKGELPTPLSS